MIIELKGFVSDFELFELKLRRPSQVVINNAIQLSHFSVKAQACWLSIAIY